MRLTTLKISEDGYVCSVAGELDAYSVDALHEELDAIVERGGRRVIADLVDVTFIDSVGLGLLLKTADRLRQEGGELVVVSGDPRTVQIFEVTGSEREFRLRRSLADAVNELAGQP